MSYILIVCLLALLTLSCQQKLIIVDGDHGDDKSCINSGTREGGGHPCRTFYQALKGITDNNTLVHILNGTYPHNTTDTTLTFSNVSITGDGADVTIVQCDHGSGFGFLNATNVSISGLTVLGCGQLRNSTTRNISPQSTLQFRAALYYLNVKGVNIDDVVVNNSTGMGVAMYDVTGSVSVTNSIFSNNSVSNKSLPGGGGFSVEFAFCRPGGILTNYCRNYNNDSYYLFKNCTFDGNTASTLNSPNTSYPGQTYGLGNQQFGRGGGLSVFFKGYSINNRIDVVDCVFSDNRAVWGGGFHSDIVDHSKGNKLTLQNCTFDNNHCGYNNQSLWTTGTGGGGARIAFLFYDLRSEVAHNSVKFILCKFQYNSAYYGGGLSCRITKEKNVVTASNSLILMSTKWSNNVARSGSGVDIISHVVPQGVSPVVEFVDCHFFKNNNSYSNLIKFPSGIGALYADNIPVNFSGDCTFIGNQDSAVAGIATSFTFSNNARVNFSNNHGWNGAAIALLGNAYIIVYDHTVLTFNSNIADTKGGAIYYVNSGQKDFVSTQRCLFYYYDLNAFDTSEWNTSFIFSSNKAREGNSIYCTTLLTCIWENLPGSVTVSPSDVIQVFNWTGKFTYSGVSNKSAEIATDTANITLYTDTVKIPPGQFYNLKIFSADDKQQSSHPVFYAYTNNSNVKVDRTTTYISDGFIKLHGRPNTSVTLHLHSINSRSWSVSISVTLDQCPPGFFFNNNTNVCQCSTDVPDQQYYGIADCDNEFLFAYLRPQFWTGYRPHNGSIVLTTIDCPEHYCNNSRIQLPRIYNSSSLGDLTCSHNRTGIVCGNCKPHYFVYVNSLTYECGPCNDSLSKNGLLVLIALKYLPMSTFMCLIMFFDVSLVDGPLNSFILFSQILTASVQLDASGKISGPTNGTKFGHVLVSIAKFCYNIWNLRFFEYLIPHFCVFKYKSALSVIVQQYVPAFYILFVCIVFFNIVPWAFQHCAHSRIRIIQSIALKIERICIRLRYRWSVRNSVIHSLTTFLVLSYARITLVTFILLTPTKLYGPGGQSSYYQEQRAWYDGSMLYFGRDHLPYAAAALMALVTFVLIPPLLLLAYPLLPVLMAHLGLEDNWIIKMLLTPLNKFVPIFDVFQSCYKDEYRYFAGLLFIYRVVALAIFAFTPTSALNLIWLQGFLLIILLLHCTVQPYKIRWHNIIEGSIFTILAGINTISFYRLFQAATTDTSTNVSFWVQMMLLYCPLVYFVVYVTIKLTNWLRPRLQVIKDCLMRMYSSDSNSRQEIADLLNNQEFPARLQDHSDDDDSSTNSPEVSEDDEQEQQQQQPDDVEMLNWLDSNESSRYSPYGRNWATQ